MSPEEAADLQDYLTASLRRFDDAKVTVAARDDGAEIVATFDGQKHRFKVGDGDSAIIRVLLGGAIG